MKLWRNKKDIGLIHGLFYNNTCFCFFKCLEMWISIYFPGINWFIPHISTIKEISFHIFHRVV